MTIDHTSKYAFFGPINDFIEYDDLSEYPDNCYLVPLTGPQIHALLIMTTLWDSYRLWSMPHETLWDSTLRDKWDTIQDFSASTKEALMAGCDIAVLVTALNEIRDAINNQNPVFSGANDSEDVLDQIAISMGISTEWLAQKVAIATLFPEAIPLSVGLDILKGLLSIANNSEAEIWSIAEVLGSTASLPD